MIERFAFSRCTGLSHIAIPESVIKIGSHAFAFSVGLTSIHIPHKVAIIEESAFRGCTGLTSITVADNNIVYDSRDESNAIIETASNKLIAGCATTVIPEGITEIEDWAFYGCTELTGITIPEGMLRIGSYAFCGCTSLTSITIPKSVTSIGHDAFSDCIGLKEIAVTNADLLEDVGISEDVTIVVIEK